MATPLARYQALHAQTLTKLEEAIAFAGPKYTVPGGATFDRMEYIKDLRATLAELEKIPGVGGDLNPPFELFA